MQTKISVIIRNRNEERWIGHAIQSILDRLYKPEIIIIDNKSTDKTLDIVKKYGMITKVDILLLSFCITL